MSIDEILRSAGQIGERGLGDINAHLFVECGKDLPKGDGALSGFSRLFVGSANDLPVAHTAAGKECRSDARPVIAPSFGIDHRCAAKFTPHDDGDILIKAALMKIGDECREPAVEQRQILTQLAEIVGMVVPPAEGKRDYARASLHQTSCGKEVFWQTGATVAVECRKDTGVLDEAPAAYKDIDQVIANQADLVEVKYQLKQVLCVKG